MPGMLGIPGIIYQECQECQECQDIIKNNVKIFYQKELRSINKISIIKRDEKKLKINIIQTNK